MALLECNFFSETLGLSTRMQVILPQSTTRQIGMESRVTRPRHPVLYLLHGLSDDDSIWLRRTSIERYVARLGLAVVMPAVHRSWYANMENGGAYWDFLSEELPAVVRSFFPVSEAREDTFVAGLSMGGYGAFKLGLSCPDRFAAAASLSGALDLAGRASAPGFEWRHEFTSIFGSVEALVDSPNDLFRLARDLAASSVPRPALYQICGTEDFLYPDNLRFRDHLRACGIDCRYEERPGGHDWSFWDQEIQNVLAWLPLQTGDDA